MGSQIKQAAKPQGKKAYTPPQLVEYGTVAHLTLGNTGSTADGMSSMNAMK